MHFDWMKNPENNLELVIMRGVSGAGKSTRAREIAEEDTDIICSADSFISDNPEEYREKFNQDICFYAHNMCKNKARSLMQLRRPLVIIDNTNVRIDEIMPYFAMAVQYQYKVRIEEPTSSWWLRVKPIIEERNDLYRVLKGMRRGRERDKTLSRLREITHSLGECAKELADKSLHAPLEVVERMIARFTTPVTFEVLADKYDPEKYQVS